jgi:hypothetical protein
MVDLRVDLIEDFKVKGFPKAMKSTSKATQVNKLRAFLKEAYRRDWMEEALHLKTRPVKAFYEEKTHTRKKRSRRSWTAASSSGGTIGSGHRFLRRFRF